MARLAKVTGGRGCKTFFLASNGSRSHENTSHTFNFGSSDVVQNIDRTSPGGRMWAVPKTVNAAARADREERQREAAELRVKCAADLGLPWPKKPRGVGRPSDTFLWQEQLCKAIDRDDLPEGLTAQPPPWWKPGKPLTRPVEEVIEMLMEDDKGDGEVVPGCGQRRQGMVSRLQRAHAQASWMGAGTKPQVRCASGSRTLRYAQEVEASSGPGPRCTPWQAACLAS